MDSHSVDASLCKSRLDVVDKNIVDVITKVDHVSIKDSNVHQIGKKSSLNENQQSTPILVSGNAAGVQNPSPGQRRVVDIVSRGVTQPKTGESWSRVNRTENDTSANPQSTPKQTRFNNTLDYLRNSEGKLIISGENMSFSGSRSHQNYCDNEAPQLDFVNHGGPRRVIPVFDGTGDIDVFFKKFESIVTACEWPEYETISRLMTDCLQGEAASILLTVPSDFIMTYTNVKKKLYTIIVDKHAPEKTRVVTIRPEAPWYNSNLAEEKRLKRKYERKYNKSKLAVDRELYCHQRDKYNNLLNTTKQDYFKNKIESATSTKELFKVCNNLLNRTNENVLPSHSCATELANRFVNYFGDKIKSIRQDLEDSSNTPDYTINVANDFDGVPLDKFRIVSQEEVRKIISSSPSKSCSLDPIPTSILKLCLDELTPVLTLVVNTSLEFADFSPELKRAFVLPLLKKAILDCEILKNFRPVSNLSFLSKLVERIVCVQLVDHLKAHHLYEVFQSAYRQLHSTETALLRVQNDLLRAVDTHGGAILVLLDLSAAFDTIDHQRLLHTLESSFGIKGKVLDWFQSYLTGRTQTVQIKKSTSEPHELKYGVPQGSVLGPILFTIYTTPLGQLIRRHGLTFHLYADDTQLYLAFKPSEPSSIVNKISRLEKCVDDIRAWMKLNLLKLNDDKTELLVITSRPSTSQSLHISIKVGDQDISPSEEPPKNLGVIFDSTCSLKDHVSNVCRSINFNLYSIGKIRKYLDRPTVEKLVNATITSRLDYCNSLMFGIPKELISQLQKRQNHAARVITKWRKYDHITPVLVDLHWLPVKQRIDFKILLLTYKALNGLAPAYMRDLLIPYSPKRTLRSTENHLLTPPRCRLEYFGKRSFAAAAPTLWNNLPLNIKQAPSVDIFKSRIKTHLFQLAYFM